MKNVRYIFLVWLLFLPIFVYAEVRISEIMYDMPGSDMGTEWLEIENTGNAVDISKWKFFEANTNHGLVVFQGTTTLRTNAFAIISNNPSQFLTTYPQFSGLLLKSSFSLSNTGESLALKDQRLTVIDSVAYSSNQGAGGDGGTLQKVNGVWVAGLPTPGAVNKESVIPTPEKATVSSKTTSSQDLKMSSISATEKGESLKNMTEKMTNKDDTSSQPPSIFSKENSKWFLALLALIVVSVVGVFVAGRKNSIKVEGIEIVE